MPMNPNLQSEYSEINELEELIEKGYLSHEKLAYLEMLKTKLNNLERTITTKELQRSNMVNLGSSDYGQLMQDEDKLKEDISTLRKEYIEFINSIKTDNYTNPIKIMCVVVSMTTCEATSLKNSLDLITNELFKSLQNYNIDDISDYYFENREEWIPYAHAIHFELINSQQNAFETRKSIRTIITNLITEFNKVSDQPIELNFVTEEFFNSAPFWEEIKKQGGIIIVDAVSLLHHKIKNILLQSQLIGEEKISILAISPINPCFIQTNQILEDFIKRNLITLDHYFNKLFNRRCEIARGDFRTINTWFYSILYEKIQLQAKAKIRNYMGSQGLPEKKGFTTTPF
jgi:hypothetical protein